MAQTGAIIQAAVYKEYRGGQSGPLRFDQFDGLVEAMLVYPISIRNQTITSEHSVLGLHACARLECYWALTQHTVTDSSSETIWHCPARGVVLATFDQQTKGRHGGNQKSFRHRL